MSRRKVVLVDDDPNDVELMLASLQKHRVASPVVTLSDGDQLLDYLNCRGSFAHSQPDIPLVIFLDINMPKIGGLEALRQIKADARLAAIPVVMLTSSREAPDLQEAYRLGANSYIVKPVDFDQYMTVANQIGGYWLLLNEQP